MPTDKKLNKLVINNLTEEQYANAVKNEDELYFTPDTTEETLNNIEKATPTDIGIKDNKLGLLHDSLWLTNQGAINLENFEYDEETNTLKPKGGEGNSVSPTLWLIDTNNLSIRTTITEVEKTNIDKGLYNQVMFFASATYDSVSDIEIYAPSKFNSSSFGNMFTIFTAKEKEDGFIINGLNLYTLDINDKDSNNEYPIKITKVIEIPIENVGKSISLFGNHSILVPSDSSDSNIDLYVHNMVMKNSAGSMQLFMSYISSSNLVVDSFTDLNTLLGATKRFIPCSGYSSPTNEGCPCIQALDWQGTYASSKFITNTNASGGLSNFTVITDDVTTV